MAADDPDDWQVKVDEVTALSAIYGDDFQLAGLQGVGGELTGTEQGLQLLQELPPPADLQRASITCTLSLDPSLPCGSLRLLLNPPDGLREAGKLGMDVGASVSHLPPLAVTLELPPGYPSALPPAITIKAPWLDPGGSVQRLQQQLAELWEQQGPGAPIAFVWLDWLQHNALQHLDVLDALVVPDHSAGGQGPTAEQVVGILLQYNAMRDAEEFNQATWRCSICFDEQRGTAFVRLPECKHHFCRSCLSQDCSIKIKDGAVDKLKCPDPKCGQLLSPSVLKNLVTQEEYARWEELLLARTLDSMQDVVYCPRCSTSTIEDPDHCAQCPACLFVFCSLCTDPWHPAQQCMDVEAKLEALQARQARAGDGGKSRAEQLRQYVDKVNQQLSLKVVKLSAKGCPRCGMAIQKSGGCNKMTCSYCGVFFCYKCGAEVSGYDHFGERGCRLFNPEDIDVWERAVNQQVRQLELLPMGALLVQAAQEMGQARTGRCPQCGQRNLKEGRNNAMRCWACGCPFCYTCRAALQGRGAVGRHFTRSVNGLAPCRQHTDD